MHKLRAALAALATLSLSGCFVLGLLLSPLFSVGDAPDKKE